MLCGGDVSVSICVAYVVLAKNYAHPYHHLLFRSICAHASAVRGENRSLDGRIGLEAHSHPRRFGEGQGHVVEAKVDGDGVCRKSSSAQREHALDEAVVTSSAQDTAVRTGSTARVVDGVNAKATMNHVRSEQQLIIK